ncbi:MAG: ABC transporter ATP-binding protein [Thermoprotei archaeon]|nr:ABC transporter ATP-binding protein [Thermoprotei archaeon]
MGSAVVARDLWKTYGSNAVLKGVNLEVYGLTLIYGPNGAGKTTLLRLFAGLDIPSSGYVSVYGLKPGSLEARRITATILEKPLLFEELTVEENLRLFSKVTGYNLGEGFALEAYEGLGVRKFLKHRVGDLSHGWRRRVDVVRAFLSNPKLILFDEVNTGFDVESLKFLGELLEGAVKRGSTVVATAPSLSGLEDIASTASFKCYIEGGILKCG